MKQDDRSTNLQIPGEKGFTITVDNAPLKPSEQQDIKNAVNKYGMDIIFLEQRAIIHSLLEPVPVFLNPDMINLLISDVMMPAAYDALKSSLHYMVVKISSRKSIVDETESGVVFRLRINHLDIFAPIPSNLSDKLFFEYMDMIKSSVTTISKEKKTKTDYEQIYFLYNVETERIDVKTGKNYIRVQMKKKLDAHNHKKPF